MAKAATLTQKTGKMAKDTLGKVGGSVTRNPTTALYIVVGVASLIALYYIGKKISRLNDFSLGNDPNSGGGNPNPNSGNNVPLGATISQNQAQNIAAGLYEAMARWGTDEDRIFSLLSGKNGKDFAMISQAYGEPRYDGVAEALWPFPKRNLGYWLNSELSDANMRKLKGLMPGVL